MLPSLKSLTAEHIATPSAKPSHMPEAEVSNKQDQLASLRSLLQKHWDRFSLDNPQTGFPLHINLPCSVLVNINPKRKRRGAIANSAMNTRVKYILSYFYFILAKAYRGSKTNSNLSIVNPTHMFHHILSPFSMNPLCPSSLNTHGPSIPTIYIIQKNKTGLQKKLAKH